MSKMTNKRKIESVGEEKYTIKVVDSFVAKNKLYLHLPATLMKTPRPTKSPGAWFSFSSKGEYYPIGLFNESGEHVTIPSKPITFCIVSSDSNAVSYETTTKPMKDGIYWFSAVRAHTTDKLSLRFYGGDDIEPLACEIAVTETDDSQPATTTSSKSSTTPAKKSSAAKSGGSTSKASVVTKDRVRPVRSTAADSGGAATTEGTVVAVQKEDSAQVVESEVASVADAVSPAVMGAPEGDSVNFVESVLPMPARVTLTNKTRIEQPLPMQDGSALKSSADFVRVRGPLFEVRMPVSLVRAVLDDRETNGARLVEYMRESEVAAAAQGKIRAMVPANLRSPTAGELFHRVQERAVAQLPGGGGNATEAVVDTLRHLFEHFFEDHVLYPAEKEAFRPRLNYLRSARKTFADEFGPYYFLRMLVLVVTGAEIASAACASGGGPGESGAKVASGAAAASALNAITNYFSSSSSSSSSGGGKGGSGRQSRNSHARMQEVLELAMALLDEQAHVLFY